ncbi:hypothetical protein MCUN1_002554 [Malassezia cuniculi]|uniref:FHA domain-containing protein n=1 Tax=Malassezia cuniculi TaxID=948313 RepID=A0AAF0EZY0_9BASI|nr:hypothetical protein MCUN1_002554 [Malassezia cuniculi]
MTSFDGVFGILELVDEHGNPRHEYHMRKTSVTFGRGAANDVRLLLEEVSRSHCAIEFDGKNRALLRVFGTGGVLVNGKHIEPCDDRLALADGDALQISKHRLRYKHAPTQAAVQSPRRRTKQSTGTPVRQSARLKARASMPNLSSTATATPTKPPVAKHRAVQEPSAQEPPAQAAQAAPDLSMPSMHMETLEAAATATVEKSPRRYKSTLSLSPRTPLISPKKNRRVSLRTAALLKSCSKHPLPFAQPVDDEDASDMLEVENSLSIDASQEMSMTREFTGEQSIAADGAADTLTEAATQSITEALAESSIVAQPAKDTVADSTTDALADAANAALADTATDAMADATTDNLADTTAAVADTTTNSTVDRVASRPTETATNDVAYTSSEAANEPLASDAQTTATPSGRLSPPLTLSDLAAPEASVRQTTFNTPQPERKARAPRVSELPGAGLRHRSSLSWLNGLFTSKSRGNETVEAPPAPQLTSEASMSFVTEDSGDSNESMYQDSVGWSDNEQHEADELDDGVYSDAHRSIDDEVDDEHIDDSVHGHTHTDQEPDESCKPPTEPEDASASHDDGFAMPAEQSAEPLDTTSASEAAQDDVSAAAPTETEESPVRSDADEDVSVCSVDSTPLDIIPPTENTAVIAGPSHAPLAEHSMDMPEIATDKAHIPDNVQGDDAKENVPPTPDLAVLKHVFAEPKEVPMPDFRHLIRKNEREAADTTDLSMGPEMNALLQTPGVRRSARTNKPDGPPLARRTAKEPFVPMRRMHTRAAAQVDNEPKRGAVTRPTTTSRLPTATVRRGDNMLHSTTRGGLHSLITANIGTGAGAQRQTANTGERMATRASRQAPARRA